MAPDDAAAPSFDWPTRVYYEDTDAGGVVYHARYLHFMERARTEWLRALGFDQHRLRAERGVLFAVRRMDLRFLSPARLDERLRVSATLRGYGRASIDFQQRVVRASDGSACCEAGVNIACLAADGLRPARIPDAVIDALTSLTKSNAVGETTHGR